jgi:hypothetical protein
MGGETLGTGFLWSIEADCPLYGNPNDILVAVHYNDLDKKLAAMASYFPIPEEPSGIRRHPMQQRYRS